MAPRVTAAPPARPRRPRRYRYVGIDYDNAIGVEVKIGGAIYTRSSARPVARSRSTTRASRTRSTSRAAAPRSSAERGMAEPGGDRAAQRRAPAPDDRQPACGELRRALTQPAAGTCGAGTSNPSVTRVRRQRHDQDAGGVRVIARPATRSASTSAAASSPTASTARCSGTRSRTPTSCRRASPRRVGSDRVRGGSRDDRLLGACLFAGTVNGTDQALLVGAEIKFTTGFTGTKN